ncbi:MAG: hypothetical protein ABSB70_16325 [Candidatus Velthaea sp.]|jgi:hypothetical protein
MEQARLDPVDRARLIVLDHLTSECCRAHQSAKSEIVTMMNELDIDERAFSLNALRRHGGSFARGCARPDEGSALATTLVMLICVMLSVAIVNWCIFHW